MSELEVLAGIVASDGHIKKNKFRIVIINKNINFIKNVILPLVKKITGKSPKPIFNRSNFDSWKFLIFVNSEFLWKTLQERFKIPAGKKSSKIKPPNLNSNKEKIDFLRGWFAGDGCPTTDRGKPRIETCSKSESLIFWIKKVLEENKIKSSVCFIKKKKQFLLDIKRLESVKKFNKIIDIPHPTKKKKLNLLLSKFKQ